MKRILARAVSGTLSLSIDTVTAPGESERPRKSPCRTRIQENRDIPLDSGTWYLLRLDDLLLLRLSS